MSAFSIQRNAPFPKELLTGAENDLYRRLKFAELAEALASRLLASERDVFGALLHSAKVDGLLADELPTYILHAEKLATKEAAL